MPTGRVKWYDAEKGFGFVSQESGDDVHVRAAALPAGVEALKSGQKVEFSVADGRKGPQALKVWLVDAPPSIVATVAAANRRSPDELHGLLEDVIKLIDSKILPELSRGRYPDKAMGKRIGDVLRAVAGELDVS